MITYFVDARRILSVYRDDKYVGAIMLHRDGNGFFYKPRGGEAGETFDRLKDVQRSIEGDG